MTSVCPGLLSLVQSVGRGRPTRVLLEANYGMDALSNFILTEKSFETRSFCHAASTPI